MGDKMTVREVAHYLKMTRFFVYRQVFFGDLPGYFTSRCLFVFRSDLETWLEARHFPGSGEPVEWPKGSLLNP